MENEKKSLTQNTLFGLCEEQNVHTPAQGKPAAVEATSANSAVDSEVASHAEHQEQECQADMARAADELGFPGTLGEVFLVEAAACAPFPGAPRAGATYDEARDLELKEDIAAHGIVEPIILLAGTSTLQILSGNRRFAVVKQLLAEGVAGALPARLANLSPVQAIAFAAAQNVGRLAPSPMQQARSIAWSLANVEPSQVKLAEALGLSEAKVSRLALLAAMPDWVLGTVTDPETLSENFAGQLQRALGVPATASKMQKRAARLAESNRTLAGPAAARYLLTGKLQADAIDLVDRTGTRHASIKEDIRGGFTVRVPPSFRRKDADVEQIHTLIAASMLNVMKKAAASAR